MPYTRFPWEDFQASSPASWLNTGLGLMDLPGEYVRGAVAGQPGERLSGEELAQHLGWKEPGAVGGMLTSMATDPLMLIGAVGPAMRGIRALRGIGSMAEGLGWHARPGTTSNSNRKRP